jgi:hypothetical protein
VKNRFAPALAAPFLGLAIAGFAAQANAAAYTQGFNDATLPSDWTAVNNSTSNTTGNPWATGDGITDADGNIVVDPYEGAGFAITNYTATGSTGTNATISNWLISPEFTTINNGDVFSFYTTTTPDSAYPDRLQFLMSSSGASVNVGTTTTSVGAFTTALLSVNPSLTVGGYPETWTLETYTVSGLSAPIDGRVAFRYFVTKGGVAGVNSNVIGVDDFTYTPAAVAVPEPASWALMFGGLGALSLLAKRRASKQG